MEDHDHSNWGEVIMENSPFSEYLKDLKNNSNIDVGESIFSEIIAPPAPLPSPPSPPPSSPSTNIQTTHPPTKGDSLQQKLAARLYHNMYNHIVGSDLLHPEESIFLCGDEEDDMKLKPALDVYDVDQLLSWTSIKKQFALRIERVIKARSILIVPLLAVVFMWNYLAGIFVTVALGVMALIGGYYFAVKYVLLSQTQIENKVLESIEQSKKHDANILKVMKAIQEVELIARGYRLSTPLSPIERLEQSAKSRKSAHMRVKTANAISQSRRILHQNSEKFLAFLSPDVSAAYLDKLSADNIAQFSEEPALAELKSAYYQYFYERSRFFSIILLAFHSVTYSHSSQQDWRQYTNLVGWQKEVSQAMSSLLLHLQTDIVELKTCVSTEFWANQIPQRVLLNKTQRTVHERFFQQSKDLKLLLQGIIARVTLCEENIHKTNNKNDTDNEESKTALAELVEQYQVVRRDLAQSLELWDSGNILLLKLIDTLSKDAEDPHYIELRNLVKDGPTPETTEEPIAPIALELLSNNEPGEDEEEQVFEAYTGPRLSDSESEDEEPSKPPPPPVSFVPGVPPPPPPMGLKFVSKKKPKKSRAERLAEKEKKSAIPSTTLVLPPEIEAKRVISELKDVLKIRKPPKETKEKIEP